MTDALRVVLAVSRETTARARRGRPSRPEGRRAQLPYSNISSNLVRLVQGHPMGAGGLASSVRSWSA